MHSQNDEERYILEWSPQMGRFLDIGAFWPFDLSNTRALYERGWSGVMVEPSPGPMRKLLDAYGHDERITLIQAAVGEGAFTDLHITDHPVSTADQKVYDTWKDAPETNYLGKMRVPVVTFRQLLDFGPFDFINIDAEGASLNILCDILGTWQPTCFCVEHDGHDVTVQRLAKSHGYKRFHTTGENIVAAK